MTDLRVISDRQRKVAERLILGTVQFGIPYGVTNARGKVSPERASETLLAAQRSGIRLVDTAVDYGASEEVLGRYLPPDIGVVTKIPAVRADIVSDADIEVVRNAISRSLERLRRTKLDAVLVHQCTDLFKPGGERLARFLEQLKAGGSVSTIGISVYDGDEIDRALELFQPDIVQVPLNLFDQRLKLSGHIDRMRDLGIQIHARSAFLQGVLLAEPSSLPTYFRQFDDQFARYREFISLSGISRIAACLGFMIEKSGCDFVIVGVTDRTELEEILSSLPGAGALPSMDVLATDEVALIDPRKWKLSEPVGEASQ
ncbi:aldo/keto reductase [Bradyrhizobium sp. G127]|uniref:aldo/keto reductase n=1 Tax=Bradyrhizobium sp. G127 TaxID=2904800 RepID=UPI001F46B49E|nr:aldo/keto reductase [Bradyrhizobium sp. G127]MCF2524445.1 aldo/keto reductase [Bradyrhizobium sp. G127]